MKNELFDKRFWTLKESAEQLGLDVKTMKKILEHAEEKLFTRVSRKFLVDKNKLLKYIDTHSNIG